MLPHVAHVPRFGAAAVAVAVLEYDGAAGSLPSVGVIGWQRAKRCTVLCGSSWCIGSMASRRAWSAGGDGCRHGGEQRRGWRWAAVYAAGPSAACSRHPRVLFGAQHACSRQLKRHVSGHKPVQGSPAQVDSLTSVPPLRPPRRSSCGPRPLAAPLAHAKSATEHVGGGPVVAVGPHRPCRRWRSPWAARRSPGE